MVAGNTMSGDIIREITAECGFEVDEEGAAVIDHINYDVNDSGKVNITCSCICLFQSYLFIG